MKTFKFALTFVSSLMMTTGPLHQAAWASSMNANQKSRFNQYLRDNLQDTYSDLYRNHSHLFDQDSRGLMESWLKNYGTTTTPRPQALIIKEKNGKETLKLIFNQSDRNLTLSFSEDDNDTFDVNGQKVSFGEVRNIPSLLQKLMATDSNLAPMSRSVFGSVVPVPRKASDVLSIGQFEKLSKLQKVEYMMLLRQNIEAAQRVFDEASSGAGTAQHSPNSPWFVFHPLFAAPLAWAETAIKVKANDKCIVAGNVSVYEVDRGHLACSPFPVKNPQGFQPQPAFHDRCTGKGQGRMVACNPLLYGTSDSGEPFCVDSGNQPRFTQKATEDCNAKSPLHGEAKSSERLLDYERILKSYANLKGQPAADLKDCFNEDHKIAARCRPFFESQYNDFVQFKNDAEKICATVKLKDQFKACDDLRKRALDLILFLESNELVSRPPIKEVNLIKEGCMNSGGKWLDEINDCLCSDHKRANSLGGNQFECAKATNPPTPPIAPISSKKDECEKNKADGKSDSSFKCNKAAWIFGIIGVGAMAYLLTQGKNSKSNPKSNPNPITPVPTLITSPTMVISPTSTTQAPSEGASGTNTGSSGGVRGTK